MLIVCLHSDLPFAALKLEAERYRNWLKEEMKNILKSVENQKKDSDLDEKLIKELQQQVKRLTATLHISQEKNAMQFKLVEDHEQIKTNLEEDILQHKISEQDLRKKNYKLEKEKEKESLKSNAWYVKYQELQEALKLKEMENTELTKNIVDEKNKLKMQQNLYEQVRSDRNLFSKQQVQSEDEIAEMKRKFKIMTHQVRRRTQRHARRVGMECCSALLTYCFSLPLLSSLRSTN
jgi:hypothetical protein